jgi:hypothetical protein
LNTRNDNYVVAVAAKINTVSGWTLRGKNLLQKTKKPPTHNFDRGFFE